MKTELKPNIFIEGFNEKDLQVLCGMEVEDSGHVLLYEGKTSEIPEELAKEYVEYYIQRCKHKNYNPDKLLEGIKLNGFNYATQSIQSACQQEFCIIYKTY